MRPRRRSSAVAAIYAQIVLGANLRHIAPDAAPWWFTLWVWLHVIVACVIVLLLVWTLGFQVELAQSLKNETDKRKKY